MKDFTGARVVNFEEVVRQRRLRKKAHAKILRSRPRTRVRKVETAFAMIPLKWAVSAAEATNNPGIALVVLLAYLAWETKSPTFVLSNERLRELGVNRWAKYRVLDRLEKAGLIHVEQAGKGAPVVTILKIP